MQFGLLRRNEVFTIDGAGAPIRSLDNPIYFDKTRNMETSPTDTKQALAALAALAQETRLSIFRLLVETGPEGLQAGAIADRLALANATLSFHLKELNHAGLIIAAPNGRAIIYSANFLTMNTLIAYLTENCCAGAACSTTVACQPKTSRHIRTPATTAQKRKAS